MISFNFRCLVISKYEIVNGFFVDAVGENGFVKLLVYGKRKPLDIMTLIKVTGMIKNEKNHYFTVDNFAVVDRFDDIRSSFSKISSALLMMEIAHKTNIELSFIIEAFEVLKKNNEGVALFLFFIGFLKKSGVFDERIYTKEELRVMEAISNNGDCLFMEQNKNVICSLFVKTIKMCEKYANVNIFKKDIVRRLFDEGCFSKG